MKTNRSWLFLILISAFACNNKTPEQTESKLDKPQHFVIDNDDIAIDVNVHGAGDTTLLFVHGWCIDQTYWENQVAYFKNNYRVVTLDLPGFGKSGKARKDWTIEAYGIDVVKVIDSLKLKNIVLIGHSMGGDIILETAVNHPKNIIGFVGVDNFKDVGTEFTPEQEAEIAAFMQEMEKDYAATATAYAQMALFHPSTDSTVVNSVINSIQNADPIIATNLLKALLAYGEREKVLLEKLNKKMFLINSDATPTDEAALGKCLRSSTHEVLAIQATGHYPMNEKAAEFNQLLESILKKL